MIIIHCCKNSDRVKRKCSEKKISSAAVSTTDLTYEGWNFNSGNYLFTTDTK